MSCYNKYVSKNLFLFSCNGTVFFFNDLQKINNLYRQNFGSFFFKKEGKYMV